ncbi:MAG: hypothetical protein M3083_09715, partial [Actinomycetota bacterium]|nr:hypothetical protein [Actinomycetota bacterium]
MDQVGPHLEYAASNNIVNNHVFRNGVFDNIGVLGVRSDHNLIQGNTVTDNFSVGLNSVGIGTNIELNAFLDFGLPDRGASQIGNQVIHNTSRRAYRYGISDRANVGEQIIGNTSTGSGVGDSVDGVGMGLQPLLASTRDLQGLIQANTVNGNSDCGIQVQGFGSRIIGNTAVGNGFNPIINTSNCNYSDLTDNGGSQPPSCPNQWLANTY